MPEISSATQTQKEKTYFDAQRHEEEGGFLKGYEMGKGKGR